MLASMTALVKLAVVLLALQLSPELTPHKAAKPALPKVDENACPFEGCQFGAWTARDGVQLYSTWKPERATVATVTAGEAVTAVTGVYITLEPLEIEVTAPMPNYGLKPGDIVLGYMNVGEGFFNAWFNGNWVDEFDGSGIATSDGSGCQRNCNAKLAKAGRNEWWVEIKTKGGKTGWTKESDKFDGRDASG